ncbi:hypothetical protein PGTUg99_000342 [Puccinia graminis f. sp. tritici]|uniref:Reverse transcriptase domain-containing protein n=1 Tax=Puccinia graminis f. sp. tritici TaxID=56615 RepID=A0A5B0Q0E1_PUCGR|nr:hypothetical protein PGTUg99_000342 [Puccinia graminis f. sp. tritici]
MRGYQGSNYKPTATSIRGAQGTSLRQKTRVGTLHITSTPPVGWPLTVKSEMNIGKWEEALSKANLLPELQGVIDGFLHGFDQGIPNHGISAMRWYTPDNHSSAILAKEKIQASIFSRSGGKKNSAEFFKQNLGPFTLALFDWEKAYRQGSDENGPMAFLMVKDLDDGLFVDTRITFGGVAGCGSFGIPADAWKRINGSRIDVVKIFRWVDDNLFIKSPNASVTISDVVSRSLDLGVQTNEGKCSEFSDEQKFIGFVWNGKDSTVRLPKAKLDLRITQIEVFLVPKAQFKFNDAEVLAGRLNHVSYLLPPLRCYLRGVYRWMNEWKKIMATRTVPDDVFLDLVFWVETLASFEHTRLVPSSRAGRN